MNRSRIIRSIIVVIFTACLVCLLGICVKNMLEVASTFSIKYKLIYLLMLLLGIFFYALLKKKLNSVNCKKSVEYSYRYIYLVMLVLITRFLAVLLYKETSSTELIKPSVEIGLGSYLVFALGKLTLYPLYSVIIINTIITFICAFCIKRMVFNITTNEMLSAIAAIGYIFIPQAILNTTNYCKENFNTLFVLFGTYMLLKIIDEVKQHKLKNNKYLKLTAVMGIFIMLDILFGGRFEYWIVILFVSLVISNNVGYVRVNNKREFVEKFSNVNTRKLMYKMEVITVNKLILVLVIILGFAAIGVLTCQFAFKQDVFEIYRNFDLDLMIGEITSAIKHTKNYYIVTIGLIILLEVLGVILRRKKDTKTTLIKLCTIMILIMTSLSNNIYSASIMDAFLVLCLILNVGNIYYNRDEKIKLLKAEN